jgi:predicted component of type VI protein secretion system
MPFQLVILRGRSEAKVHRLGPGLTVAGRQEGCQLQVKGSQVSRKHCEFFEQDGVAQVKDLGSSNGTYVNGERIEGQRALRPGDEILIGGIKFRLDTVTDAARPHETAPPAPVSPPDSDDGAIPFDEDETVQLAPNARPAAHAPAAAPAAAAAAAASPAEPQTDETEGGPELGEDAVADFLLDLDIDDTDRP